MYVWVSARKPTPSAPGAVLLVLVPFTFEVDETTRSIAGDNETQARSKSRLRSRVLS